MVTAFRRRMASWKRYNTYKIVLAFTHIIQEKVQKFRISSNNKTIFQRYKFKCISNSKLSSAVFTLKPQLECF